MRVKAFGIAWLFVTLLVTGAPGQERPNLSGTWTASPDAPAGMTAAPSPVFGQRFAIDHKGDTLTLVRPQRVGSGSATLTLDGTETRMRVTGTLCQGDFQSIEKAVWEGDAIAHTVLGIVPPGGDPLYNSNVKRLFRMQGPDALRVEATIARGGTPTQVATVYTRTTETMPPVPTPATGPKASIAQLEWVTGTWTRTTGPTTVEERWTPAAGGATIGVSRTLRTGIQSAFEFLCIVERGGTLVYSAMPGGRSPATDFTLTSITADAATFENPAHDFPTLIRYRKLPDGSLETTVSGPNGARAQSVVMKQSN